METLCHKIDLPDDVTQQILQFHALPDFPTPLQQLTDENSWTEGLQQVKASLGDDPNGYRMLCCMLRCALVAKQEYDRMGISEEIYYDTMACFSRFVREHYESFDRWGFDREWWTVRQVSCKLLRIGQLEYEFVTYNGEKAISLHIPSDASLELSGLRASYMQARALITQGFPDYADVPMICHSWLLSPTLQELLPTSSRILKFQDSFEITGCSATSTSFLQWIYKNAALPLEELPENTTLQRNLKEFLLAGGSFLTGEGTLIPEPFLQCDL